MIDYGSRLIVQKDDFQKAIFTEGGQPDNSTLKEGEVLLQLEKFAYTANNTTYALVGKRIGYWNFFPVKEEHLGIIPCWGFGRVIHSKTNDIAVGQRYYGFYPMASHLIVQPGLNSQRGFTDIATHRQPLPVIYNQYIDCQSDPLYQSDQEDLQALFRPLFTTSFLIHDQLILHKYYNSQQVILISASSKTALSLASCLKNDPVKVVGITSDRNMDFVNETGYYDKVFSYNDIMSIQLENTSIVDFAGNHSIQLKLQNHLEGHLQNVCMVGMVRYETQADKPALPTRPEFFFAPTYAAIRIKELGPKEFGLRLAKKYKHFIKDASGWINIKQHHGKAHLTTLHQQMTDGDIFARDGHIFSF